MKNTRTIQEIEKDIAQTKEALTNVRGSETEVYARIVGYYRSVRNWNKGKRDEYDHRKMFDEQNDCGDCYQRVDSSLQETKAVRYELFARKTCPNCPPVKEYMANSALAGETIDADTPEGASKAADMGVFSAPTVILYDSFGAEVARAHSVQELSALVATPVTQLC